MSYEESFGERQKEAQAKILKLAKKAPDYTRFVIDDKNVSKKDYVDALKVEGAHKLPFAYSKCSVTFYLLTSDYLKGDKK